MCVCAMYFSCYQFFAWRENGWNVRWRAMSAGVDMTWHDDEHSFIFCVCGFESSPLLNRTRHNRTNCFTKIIIACVIRMCIFLEGYVLLAAYLLLQLIFFSVRFCVYRMLKRQELPLQYFFAGNMPKTMFYKIREKIVFIRNYFCEPFNFW